MSSVHFPPFAGNLFERRGLSIARCFQPLMSSISDSSDAIQFELHHTVFFSIQTLSDNSTRGMGQQWFGSTTNCWPRNPTGWRKPSLVVLLPKDQFYMIIEYFDRPDAVFPAHQDSGWIRSFALMPNFVDNTSLS